MRGGKSVGRGVFMRLAQVQKHTPPPLSRAGLLHSKIYNASSSVFRLNYNQSKRPRLRL